MDGIHDLGGMHGFGQVEMDVNEPVFHARWEAAVFAMSGSAFVAGAYRHADQFRHAIERIDPVSYLTHSYYGRWLGGIETLLVEAGVISQQELTERAIAMGATLDDRIAARPRSTPAPLGPAASMPGTPRPVDHAARFQSGDRVVTSIEVKSGHTRLPRYARGKHGIITHCHDGWVFPDSSARGEGEDPQHLYTVRFSGQELWGAGADPKICVHLDLFEPYLQPAAKRS